MVLMLSLVPLKWLSWRHRRDEEAENEPTRTHGMQHTEPISILAMGATALKTLSLSRGLIMSFSGAHLQYLQSHLIR